MLKITGNTAAAKYITFEQKLLQTTSIRGAKCSQDTGGHYQVSGAIQDHCHKLSGKFSQAR